MQRSKAEDSLFSLSTFAAHLQNAPIGVGIAHDGIIKFINQNLCSMLG